MAGKENTPLHGKNLRLTPLFVIVFSVVLALFAVAIGTASYFLWQGQRSLVESTQELNIRMALVDSAIIRFRRPSPRWITLPSKMPRWCWMRRHRQCRWKNRPSD
ncbi:hypothetical protein AU489_07520 [Lonsdalea populi]|uniref:Uncharacterized protein n=1 Tax=Lonsdalea quercina TaxID=71657 RepID=A0ACD1JA97_9GAMM|nr:hypothetical protein AU485_13795 [Lonsdalea quercina]RAT19322.1 hypothetical protein AU487_11600 [Lonsdalea populi]RAT22902.1 hypothetical protein AU488_10480 [Lonsdalea populi]RAT25127.1 hypothetical protein AU489_07520 [Lonsdalea populi]RAT38496.1 hypothetical protein AU493_04790 [Lonsdalea populi]